MPEPATIQPAAARAQALRSVAVMAGFVVALIAGAVGHDSDHWHVGHVDVYARDHNRRTA